MLPQDVLELINSQYDALQFLSGAAREGRDVSLSMIRELHVALTRRQPTYPATGPGGIVFQATLHHGQWKTQPDHVTRRDGSKLEYTPPEQVQPQLERLVELCQRTGDADPIVRTAWLHHRFVRIHPFEDGDGRVARCLTLLGLLRADLAPLVVDRRDRTRYLDCLDRANEGDLRPLARFFAELEIVALRNEIEAPVVIGPETAAKGALAVLSAGAERLRNRVSQQPEPAVTDAITALAQTVHTRIERWLREMSVSIAHELADGIDVRARASVSTRPVMIPASEPLPEMDPAARDTLHDSESRVAILQVHALGHTLGFSGVTFCARTVGAGLVLFTTSATIIGPAGTENLAFSPASSVTWTHEESADTHWERAVEVLDSTLAGALQKFIAALT